MPIYIQAINNHTSQCQISKLVRKEKFYDSHRTTDEYLFTNHHILIVHNTKRKK